MATIAVYSLKGGVGKTTLAVNLAWCAASSSARRTLLWDLDPQAAASFILGGDPPRRERASAIFARDLAPEKLIRPTGIDRFDLIPADASLRGLDQLFSGLGKKKRVRRLIEDLGARYDRVILDCPPGLTDTSEQVMRAADVVVVPLIPSALSRRAFDTVIARLAEVAGKVAVLPVFSMVDRRRSLHNIALAADPDWPVVPMASAVETMATRRRPLGAYASASPAAQAIAAIWTGIERKLAG